MFEAQNQSTNLMKVCTQHFFFQLLASHECRPQSGFLAPSSPPMINLKTNNTCTQQVAIQPARWAWNSMHSTSNFMTDGHLHPTTQTASPYQQHQSPTSKVSNITPYPSMCWTRPTLALCSNPCWQDTRFKFHHHIWPRISPNPCSKFFLLISSKLVLYIYARIMLVANPSNQFNAQHCVNPCSHKQRTLKQLPSL